MVQLKIEFKVDDNNRADVVKWFRNVHINSRIDFMYHDGDRVRLINADGRDIEVQFNDSDFIKHIVNSKKTYFTIEESINDLGPIAYKDTFGWQQFYDKEGHDRKFSWCRFYHDFTLEKMKNTLGAFYLVDIDYEDEETYSKVSIHIQTAPVDITYSEDDYKKTVEVGYFEKKCEFERKLTDLFFDHNIYKIPATYNKKNDIKKAQKNIFNMLFSLKGMCKFEFVEDEMKMYMWKYIHNVYMRTKRNGSWLNEYFDLSDDEKYQYEIPDTTTLPEILELMGMYTEINYNDRVISICPINIHRAFLGIQYTNDKKKLYSTMERNI